MKKEQFIFFTIPLPIQYMLLFQKQLCLYQKNAGSSILIIIQSCWNLLISSNECHRTLWKSRCVKLSHPDCGGGLISENRNGVSSPSTILLAMHCYYIIELFCFEACVKVITSFCINRIIIQLLSFMCYLMYWWCFHIIEYVNEDTIKQIVFYQNIDCYIWCYWYCDHLLFFSPFLLLDLTIVLSMVHFFDILVTSGEGEGDRERGLWMSIFSGFNFSSCFVFVCFSVQC